MVPLTLSIVLGVVLGVAFAEWARRKHGTVEFYSKSENFTPDIDDFVKKADSKKSSDNPPKGTTGVHIGSRLLAGRSNVELPENNEWKAHEPAEAYRGSFAVCLTIKTPMKFVR